MTDASVKTAEPGLLKPALEGGLIAGLISIGIIGPFIGLQAVQNMDNKLVLAARPALLICFVLLIATSRFVFLLPGALKLLTALFGGVALLVLGGAGMAVGGFSTANGYVAGFGDLVVRSIAITLGSDGGTPSLLARIAAEAVTVGAFHILVGLFLLLVVVAGLTAKGASAAPGSAVVGRGLATILPPILIGAVIAYPLVMLDSLGPGGSIKWIDNFGIQILIYVMLGWGLNIVVGLAGLLDLGYVAFYAVGAYSYALLAKNFGLSFWVLLPLAGMLAACWGIILGFPVLRLRGDYLAIVTMAFGEIIRLILINWVDFTNGYAGISGIPRPTLFGVPFTANDDGFVAKVNGFIPWFGSLIGAKPDSWWMTFQMEFSPIYRTIFLFYVILFLALITAFVTLRLRRLPVGRAWEALREDEIACRSLGINTTTTKLTAFALGAMFGGFAGSFFAARQGFISPESFTFMESAQILAIVVLGGMGSLYGVVIASIVLVGGFELMRELDFLKQIFGESFDPTQYRTLLFGLAMVLIMLWKPRGLISTREPTAFLKTRKSVSGTLVKEGHG
ncbi:MAG: high-affinity branched-chain amino acid ABC transporter permease LivM [Ancalomicrobiaceae bacterium]|nr:high-affinity branched-chain amino acid ABC transporter permease LivM [Ancalomicrobiaceae bacterium]